MDYINLSKIENQSFFVMTGGVQVDFRLHYFREVLYADISVDGTLVAGSVRCVAMGWLLPRAYTKGIGNFRFETADDAYPNAKDFGETCFLVHYGQDEIDGMEG